MPIKRKIYYIEIEKDPLIKSTLNDQVFCKIISMAIKHVY